MRSAGNDTTWDDAGSAPTEFVLVGALLTVLTLSVLQLGFALYVRNVIHDAAVDGAFYAALADTTVQESEQHTRERIREAVGAAFAEDIVVRESTGSGPPIVSVVVRAPIPLIGLIGPRGAWEVTARAPVEVLD